MPKLFERCQKEVDDALKKLEDSRTKDQKEQDKQDQVEKNYSWVPQICMHKQTKTYN